MVIRWVLGERSVCLQMYAMYMAARTVIQLQKNEVRILRRKSYRMLLFVQ